MLQPEALSAFMRQLVYFEGNTNQQHILNIELLKRDRKEHTTQSPPLAVAMEVENRVAMVNKMVAFILVGFGAVAWIGLLMGIRWLTECRTSGHRRVFKSKKQILVAEHQGDTNNLKIRTQLTQCTDTGGIRIDIQSGNLCSLRHLFSDSTLRN